MQELLARAPAATAEFTISAKSNPLPWFQSRGFLMRLNNADDINAEQRRESQHGHHGAA
jgi:hypothetical protein